MKNRRGLWVKIIEGYGEEKLRAARATFYKKATLKFDTVVVIYTKKIIFLFSLEFRFPLSRV